MIASQISTDLIIQFEAVARHKSLKRAAQELNLSPAAVTQSLKQLEVKLEKTLCIRGKNHFSLTESGEEVYRSAIIIKNELSNLNQNLYSTPENFSGLFSIGIMDNFSSPKYKKILQEIVNTFPSLTLSVQAIDPREMIEWVKAGELDVGFGIFHEEIPPLCYTKIGSGKLNYHISRSHKLFKEKKITKSSLYGENLTWHGSELRKRSELKNEIFGRDRNYKMKLRAYTNNESAALDILDTGFSVVPLPSSCADKSRRDTGIAVKTPELNHYLVHNPNIIQGPVLKYILAYLN